MAIFTTPCHSKFWRVIVNHSFSQAQSAVRHHHAGGAPLFPLLQTDQAEHLLPKCLIMPHLHLFRNNHAFFSQPKILEARENKMASCHSMNCTFLDQYEKAAQGLGLHSLEDLQLPPFLADTDIAGLGVNAVDSLLFFITSVKTDVSCQVILAFFISAYSAWTVVAVGYAFGYIDQSLLGNLDRRLIRVKPRQSDRWQPLLVKVVLMLRSVPK